MSDLNHPIWKYFISDSDDSFTCTECYHYYRNKPRLSTLKNHFRIKHKEIWNNIRKDKIENEKKINQNDNLLNQEIDDSLSFIELSDDNNIEIVTENIQEKNTSENSFFYNNLVKNIIFKSDENIEIK